MQWPLRFILWVLEIILQYLILMPLGILICGTLSLLRAWKQDTSLLGKPIQNWKYRWAWLWGNDEDGICDRKPVTPLAAFKWTALRNSVANLRWVCPFGFTIRPSRVRSIGNNSSLYLPGSGWHLTWHGLYSGLWIRCKSGRQFRIGWLLVPDDAKGFDVNNLRQVGCGFSIQINKG